MHTLIFVCVFWRWGFVFRCNGTTPQVGGEVCDGVEAMSSSGRRYVAGETKMAGETERDS